jgi:hypothetical protein
MFPIVRAILWIFALWKWGDWKNWKKYEATILYVIIGDLLYNFLTYNYSMWQFEPAGFLSNHTLHSLFIAFVMYPCSTILYLGGFPVGRLKQILWVILWITIWIVIEWVNCLLRLITYHHGWDFLDSVLFSCVAVPMIRLHYKRSLWAYGLSVAITVSLLLIFKVPISK